MIQIDWILVQGLLREPRKPLPDLDGHCIFTHNLGTDVDPSVYELIDSSTDQTHKVDVTLLETELLVYPVPSQAKATPSGPAAKKRKIKATPREPLMTIPVTEEIADDFALFRDASRLSIPLTQQLGPYIHIQPGRISLIFALYLGTFCPGGVSDTATGQLQTVQRVFARALDSPAIAYPESQQAGVEEMFAALTAPKDEFSKELFSVPNISTPLHSYQCQSVRWCLAREGCTLVDNEIKAGRSTDYDLGWTKLGKYYVNPFSSRIQTEEPTMRGSVLGGLLADEMGLGKTLEVIALTQLHQRTGSLEQIIDERTGDQVQQIKATLVIVPAGILDQWSTELGHHAPSLHVGIYTGKRALSPEDLAEFDVVLASYSTIAAEIHAASFNPGLRNTRFWKHRPDINSVKSSLVQVEFWRVIMDEVQMIHAGVNNAARVAGLVPRVNAWAVTGTPVKGSIHDLRGQFGFLKLHPYTKKTSFSTLLGLPEQFANLVSLIGIRHTKLLLRNELRLPPQDRKLIMLKFNEAERVFYDDVRAQAASVDDPDSEASKRALLLRLRQACCIHAIGGGMAFESTPLTMEQALDHLVAEVQQKILKPQRQKVAQALELGQLYLMNDDFEQAISIFKQQLATLQQELEEFEKSRQDLQKRKLKAEANVKKQKDVIAELNAELHPLGEQLAQGLGKVVDSKRGPKYDLEDVAFDPKFSELRFKVVDEETVLSDLKLVDHDLGLELKNLASMMSQCRERMHRACFMMGTAYFRIGEKTPSEETAKLEEQFYNRAEELRSDLLAGEQANFVAIKDKLKHPGIFKYEQPSNVFEEFFNKQANKMQDIYSQLLEILQTGLLELDSENQDVYATSMELQEKANVFLNAIKVMLQDRERFIVGPKLHDKQTKSKRKAVAITDDEKEKSTTSVLERTVMRELVEIKRPLEDHLNSEKRRVALANDKKLKEIDRSIAKREDVSDITLEKVASMHHQQLDKLKADLRAWKRELNALFDVFNARLEYYKGLQNISDKIREPEVDDIGAHINRVKNGIARTDVDIEKSLSRLAYVRQIQIEAPSTLEDKAQTSQGDICVICQDSYKEGSFTTCGHRCCTSCLRSWLSRNPICPLCKTKLGPEDVFAFKYEEPVKAEVKEEKKELVDDLGDIYSHISPSHFNKITKQPIKKSYGIKIDTIVKHVQLLRQQDPQVQIVVFTQWARMLTALTQALTQHGIRAIRKTQPKSVTQFRNDKSITCFMLHTSNDSAGLTLTNATHVILCEPLLTTAIELQAISRIHRIGQERQTSVWLFAIENTVEQKILALSTKRRSELAKQKHQTDEMIESEIITSAMGNLVDRSSGSEAIVVADIHNLLQE